MRVEKIPLLSIAEWTIIGGIFWFGRKDSKFWRLIGISVRASGAGQREVNEWQQPMMEETGQGVVVILRNHTSGELLLTAKAEPGNDASGRILLAATIQASQSNLEAAHKGRRPPRSEILGRKRKSISWMTIHQDGGKFVGKRNRYAVLNITPEELGELLPHERWFTVEETIEALREGEVNEHLAQALAVMFAENIRANKSQAAAQAAS